nr:MAG TPA: hypothetical protein [Caudoviricetes sp.]
MIFLNLHNINSHSTGLIILCFFCYNERRLNKGD